MERGVRDDDAVQEMICDANMFYAAGTHRSGRIKESQRTPGPGAYRTPSSFPLKAGDEVAGHHIKKRAPSWQITERTPGRVADIGNPFLIVPPVVGLFRKQAEGDAWVPPPPLAKSRITISTMPPVNASGVILKGHSGDVPKGHGLPY